MVGEVSFARDTRQYGVRFFCYMRYFCYAPSDILRDLSSKDSTIVIANY